MAQLLDERDLGVLTAVMSLLVSLVATAPESYENCVPKCVKILERLTRSQDIPQEYTYYGIPSPWLQVGFALHSGMLKRTIVWGSCDVVHQAVPRECKEHPFLLTHSSSMRHLL